MIYITQYYKSKFNTKKINMNKYLIILALETLLEQVIDSRENSTDHKDRIKEIEENIKIIKNK